MNSYFTGTTGSYFSSPYSKPDRYSSGSLLGETVIRPLPDYPVILDAGVPANIRDKYNDYSRRAYRAKRIFNGWWTGMDVFTDIMSRIDPLFKIAKPFIANARNRFNTEYEQKQADNKAAFANWYNSPAEQMRRMRKAGINPFFAGNNIRNFPAETGEVMRYPETVTSDFDFLDYANLELKDKLTTAKIDNLQSVTEINNYQHDYIMPQIFEKNGYLNKLSELEAAYAENNYEWTERTKRELLETRLALARNDMIKDFIKLGSMKPGYRTYADMSTGNVYYENLETGEKINLMQVPVNELPIEYQEYLYGIKNSNVVSAAQAASLRANASSANALSALYGTQEEKLNKALTQYEESGTWPDDDPVIRAAAGYIDWETMLKAAGFNAGEEFVGGTGSLVGDVLRRVAFKRFGLGGVK